MMKKKTRGESSTEDTPKETVDLKVHQEVLNQNELLKELKNLEDDGYYRIKLTSILERIATSLNQISESLEEVKEAYLEDGEDEEKD